MPIVSTVSSNSSTGTVPMVRSGSRSGTVAGAVAMVSTGPVVVGEAATVGDATAVVVVVVVLVVVEDEFVDVTGAVVLGSVDAFAGAAVVGAAVVDGAAVVVDASGSGTVDGTDDDAGSSLLAESVTWTASRLARITSRAKPTMRLVRERPVGVGVVDVVMVSTAERMDQCCTVVM